ncbi:MAG: diadenylate cyclase CdaA [Spirochaetota bacterium]
MHFADILQNWLRPVLDILLLAFLVYKTWELLVSTQAVQLLKGALALAAFWAAAFFLQLGTVSWVLNALAPGLVIALAIVFQPELRKIVLRLGQGPLFKGKQAASTDIIDSVINAAEMLSSSRRGALVVFGRSVGLKSFTETGTRLDAVVSSSLLVSVFAHDTPLHDGAVVIQDGRAEAAGCFLPLSEQQDIRKSFGTRHRAALGLSEMSDAVILVVSEETGAISLAYDSRLFYGLSVEEVTSRLGELLSASPGAQAGNLDG